MAISLVDLSPQAQLVLEAHVRQPDQLFYANHILGGLYSDKDIDRLDKAYVELKECGLMEPTLHIVSDFGVPKRLYKLTEAGRDLAKELLK
jgi:hypothetical protein